MTRWTQRLRKIDVCYELTGAAARGANYASSKTRNDDALAARGYGSHSGGRWRRKGATVDTLIDTSAQIGETGRIHSSMTAITKSRITRRQSDQKAPCVKVRPKWIL